MKHAQQLRLPLEWHVADLVEAQGGLVSELETADLLDGDIRSMNGPTERITRQ